MEWKVKRSKKDGKKGIVTSYNSRSSISLLAP